jgi:hypothetical protein
MDPDASVLVLGLPMVPAVGPWILQLSTLPGNISKLDHFFYNSAANVSQGDFGAVIAFASTHGHLVLVHDCPDLQEWQAAHPSAIVHPLSKIYKCTLTLLHCQSWVEICPWKF